MPLVRKTRGEKAFESEPRVTVSVSLSIDLIELLNEVRDETHISRSSLVNNAIREYMLTLKKLMTKDGKQTALRRKVRILSKDQIAFYTSEK